MRPVCILAIPFAAALTAAGCGGSDQSNGSGGRTTSTSTGSAGGDTGGSGGSGAGASSGGSGGSQTGNTTGGSGGNVTGSNAGGSTATSMCAPLTDDASEIGAACGPDAPCPTGYTCEQNGFGSACAIACEQDCECPETLVCKELMIEGMGTVKQCAKP